MKHNYKKFIFFIILLVILKIFFTKKCENIEIYKFEKTKNPTILLIAGTHGNEPAGTKTFMN